MSSCGTETAAAKIYSGIFFPLKCHGPLTFFCERGGGVITRIDNAQKFSSKNPRTQAA